MHAHADAAHAVLDERVGGHHELDVRAGLGQRVEHGLVGEVEAVEPLELKGKAERVPAYRLIDVRDTAHDHQPSTVDAPLVGREPQLEALRAGLREVAGRGGARIATVLGEAGVGKSYLVDAFQAEVGSATTVLRGRCLPYGDGITFWPLVEVLRAAAAIADDDSPEGTAPAPVTAGVLLAVLSILAAFVLCVIG